MAALPRTVHYVPDPRWPWNPAYDVTIRAESERVTDEALELTLVAEGVERRCCGWRESFAYWMGWLRR